VELESTTGLEVAGAGVWTWEAADAEEEGRGDEEGGRSEKDGLSEGPLPALVTEGELT